MYSLMIVDDEKWIRRGLVEAIDWSSLGIVAVREAENGEQALLLARNAPPDVVITDIRMSGIGGLMLCDELGARYPDTRMILISGHRDFSFAQQAIRLGVSDYLLKPIDERALLHSVKQCLFQIERQRAFSAGAEAASAPPQGPRDEMHPAVREVVAYIKKNYAGKITLFAAEHREDWFGSHADPQLGWGPWARGGVETHRVPGSHLQMVLEPNVATLADKLRACLRCADALARR